MRNNSLAFVAGLGVAIIGAATLPMLHRNPLGPTVTTEDNGTIVQNIRQLNRLVVFQAFIAATTTTHEVGWFTQSDQTMITPAFVNYYVDMTDVNTNTIRIVGNKVLVYLPPLKLERPNVDMTKIEVYNAGVFSLLSSTTDRLRVANSAKAIKQLKNRAAMPFLVDAARKAAFAAVTANITNALAANGHRDLQVQVVR